MKGENKVRIPALFGLPSRRAIESQIRNIQYKVYSRKVAIDKETNLPFDTAGKLDCFVMVESSMLAAEAMGK